MEFKNTLEALHNQVDEIKKLAAHLERYEKIRAIDIDLLLEKLRNVYDVAIDLQAAVADPDEQFEPEPKEEQGNTIEFEVEETPVNKVVKKEPRQEVKPKTESKVVEDQVFTEPKASNISESEPEPESVPKASEKSSVSEQFASSRTLNEEISGSPVDDKITAQLKKQPISSIHSALGLNEKFELINELFNGDKSHFEQTLGTLNKADTFVEAFNYMEANFQWDMESPYVQRLLELIRRKLIVNRNE